MYLRQNIVDSNRNNIPQELRDHSQWVCWVKRDKGNSRMDKLPIISGTSDMASVDELGTWGDFDTAWKAYEAGQADGVGFVVSKDDLFCGIDLDDCLNLETGKIEQWALDVINNLSSYTEISPSGKGIRIFVKAKKPGERCKLTKAAHQEDKEKEGKFEIYDSGRFLTVTGNIFNGSSLSIAERQQEVERIYNHLFGDEEKEQGTMPQTTITTSKFSDEIIIQKAINAVNGDKFQRLMDGDITGYASGSEADLALASILAFWTQDGEQIFRIVKQSRLYDAKWERDDYKYRTIQKALQNVSTNWINKDNGKDNMENNIKSFANGFKQRWEANP